MFGYHATFHIYDSCSVAELFPLDVRSVMSGLSNCIANIYIFTVVKTFPALASKSVPGKGGFCSNLF